ncbi:MAG: penicillin-binding protein activator [Pseudomonadota bacterium]
MTSWLALRVRAPLPILFFAVILILAGCATPSTGPVTPPSSGAPRVDPTDPQPITNEDDGTGEEAVEEDQGADADRVVGLPYTPPHMADREILRAGVLLPFSDRRERVRAEAEGMLAGIELALFENAGDTFVILPHDTRGSMSTAISEAEKLLSDGADIILGPLFGANANAIKDIFAAEGVPVISFSNDTTVAGGGTWLGSIAPEAEVQEIVRFAHLRGYDRFAFFGPQSALGQKLKQALETEAMAVGGAMLNVAFYPESSTDPRIEAETFANSIMAAVERGERVAVLVPERGTRLRRIAPLLAYYGLDTREVKMLGIGAWNDPAVWREPSLNGAWFPAPPQADLQDFETRYRRQYGAEPSSLSSLAYDATALAITLAGDGIVTAEEIIDPEGFVGVNGLFRYSFAGIAERSLSILEIDRNSEGGAREIRGVANSFRPAIN